MSPASDIRIVPATERDVPLVHALIGKLADYERLTHEMEVTEDDVREALFGDWPAAEALLAYTGGEAVGYAIFYHTFSSFAGRRGLYLEDVFVMPAYRGRGIGRRLLAQLAWIAVDRRCARMEWAVLDWNERAIRFYRSVGAIPMDDWTVYRVSGEALTRLADL